jgi:hypothetical protein
MFKKIIVISAISLSSLFAFDFSSALDKVTNKVADSVSDKASSAAEKQIDSTFSEEKKATSGKADQLRELAQMKKEGLITEEEYNQQKQVVLSAK